MRREKVSQARAREYYAQNSHAPRTKHQAPSTRHQAPGTALPRGVPILWYTLPCRDGKNGGRVVAAAGKRREDEAEEHFRPDQGR